MEQKFEPDALQLQTTDRNEAAVVSLPLRPRRPERGAGSGSTDEVYVRRGAGKEGRRKVRSIDGVWLKTLCSEFLTDRVFTGRARLSGFQAQFRARSPSLR